MSSKRLLPFAKLFEIADGQVLVHKDNDEKEDPCIRISCQPDSEMVNISTVIMSFSNEEKRNKAFELFDTERAAIVSSGILKVVDELTGKAKSCQS